MRKGTFLLNHSTLKGVMDLAEDGVLVSKVRHFIFHRRWDMGCEETPKVIRESDYGRWLVLRVVYRNHTPTGVSFSGGHFLTSRYCAFLPAN